MFVVRSGFAPRAVRVSPGLLAIAIGLGAAAAGRAQDAFVPNAKPQIVVPRVDGGIRVDGVLDEPAWQQAVCAANFAEITPGDQCRPPVDTEVLLAYDDRHLYLGFKAKDDPQSVRTSLRDRDQIFADDWIGIILDTYGDAAWAYELFMNPMGVQGDLRWTPNDEDTRFDIVFESRGKLTDDGYVVEAAVPFASLRFPDRDEQQWRATFIRTQPRDSRRQFSWATISRDEPCFPCQFGTLTGISGVKRSKSLEILPSVTGSQFALRDAKAPNGRLESDKVDADVGLGVRYSLTSSLTADATVNPDFSQVESDAAQIDVNTTFALFYPEKRPFFQEGGDLFDTWIDAVYTRQINDPAGAVKLTGRQGRTSIGYIGARDEHTPIVLPFEERSRLYTNGGRSYSNILRVKRTFGEDSFLGGLVTDQRFTSGGGTGTVMGGDSSWRFKKNYRIEVQGLASHTEEPDAAGVSAGDTTVFERGAHTSRFDGEDFWGRAAYASFERDARVLQWDFDYWETSPTFRAANGFVTQNDNRRTHFWTGTQFRPNGRVVEQVFPNVALGRVWNFDGKFKDEWVRPEMSLRFKRQTGLNVQYLWSNENFHGKYFGGIRRASLNLWTDGNARVQPGIWAQAGRFIARNNNPVLGEGFDFQAWATIKPMQRFVIEPEYSYSELSNPNDGPMIFAGYILRSRFSYQFTRQMFARLVLQYDNFDDAFAVDPLLTYRINPFTVFYAGSTHDFARLDPASGSTDLKQVERQYFAKLQYLFRI